MKKQNAKHDKLVVVLIAFVTLLFVINFPVRYKLKDGGSVVYKSILWEYENVNSMYEDDVRLVGKRFSICGQTVVDDVQFVSKD